MVILSNYKDNYNKVITAANNSKGFDLRPIQFTMRVMKYYNTALSIQVGEAVRIRKSGGEGYILNSKSEYNRCKIPRPIIEEQDEEQIKKG